VGVFPDVFERLRPESRWQGVRSAVLHCKSRAVKERAPPGFWELLRRSRG
jgi:hypothetical protein